MNSSKNGECELGGTINTVIHRRLAIANWSIIESGNRWNKSQ